MACRTDCTGVSFLLCASLEDRHIIYTLPEHGRLSLRVSLARSLKHIADGTLLVLCVLVL